MDLPFDGMRKNVHPVGEKMSTLTLPFWGQRNLKINHQQHIPFTQQPNKCIAPKATLPTQEDSNLLVKHTLTFLYIHAYINAYMLLSITKRLLLPTTIKCRCPDAPRLWGAALGITGARQRRQGLTTGRADKDDSKPSATHQDWIPPNRPLIGDQLPQQQQQLYYQPPAVDNSNPSTTLAASAVDDNDDEEELRRLQQEIDKLEQAEPTATTTKTDTIEEEDDEEEEEEEELRLLQQEIDELEKEEEKEQSQPQLQQSFLDEDTSIDWLKTRRRVMGGDAESNNLLTASLPGKARHQDLFEVDVIHHTLLNKTEIAAIVQALGGEDIKVIYDDPHHRRMGGALGMIIVTAERPSQMRALADTLVRQMRRRKLQHVDVIGAQQGPEGTPESNWMVVDCRNFIVHFMGPHTRRAVNLEDIWSGKDDLHKVNVFDDDAVEDYVAAHPVP